MSDRYVVTELEGYSIAPTFLTAGNARVGLSCMVIDTLACRRLVATFRSEDQHGPWAAYVRKTKTRKLASDLAARLNAT